MILAKPAETPLAMSLVTDPEEIARAQAQKEKADRNSDWLQAHVPEIYSRHRGKYVCVAGEELFVADTVQDVLALASAAHPEDTGRLMRYIPPEKAFRIYANQRTVASV